MTIVDTRRDGADGRLKIPLYEIKDKTFLHNKALEIVSDGRHFAALEKECNDIKRSGVTDVFAILPPRQDLTGGDEHLLSQGDFRCVQLRRDPDRQVADVSAGEVDIAVAVGQSQQA